MALQQNPSHDAKSVLLTGTNEFVVFSLLAELSQDLQVRGGLECFGIAQIRQNIVKVAPVAVDEVRAVVLVEVQHVVPAEDGRQQRTSHGSDGRQCSRVMDAS